MMTTEMRVKKAEELFRAGFNCSQATFAAFADLAGLTEEEALRLSSSFGGGYARQREVCGAASGAALALGAIFGYDRPDGDLRRRHYALVSEFLNGFRDRRGSLTCRDLLRLPEEKVGQDRHNPVPAERNAEFFAKRPCLSLIRESVACLCPLLIREANERALSMLKPGWNSSDRFPGTMDLPIRYQLWIPEGFDPARRYPVLLFLHGDGSRGSDNLTQIRSPNASVLHNLTQRPEYNRDVILFAPQCTREESWVPSPPGQDGFVLTPQPAPCLADAFAAFSYWLERLPADHSRLYYWGNSRGALAGWDLLSRYPGLFSGAVLVAGRGDSAQASILAGEHIRIHHGTADTVVRYACGEKMFNAIKAADPRADVELIPYPERKHDIFPDVGNDEGVLRWLFSRKK